MILGVSVKSADLTLNAPVYTRRNLKKRGPATANFFVNKKDLGARKQYAYASSLSFVLLSRTKYI